MTPFTCWNTDWMPQKHPPANTTVSVFGGAGVAARANPGIAGIAATSAPAMSPRVNPRIMIPPSVPLSRSPTPYRNSDPASVRAIRNRHLLRIAGAQHLDHLVRHVPRTDDPDADDQQQNDQADQKVLVPAHVSENDQRRLAERPADRREDDRPARATDGAADEIHRKRHVRRPAGDRQRQPQSIRPAHGDGCTPRVPADDLEGTDHPFAQLGPAPAGPAAPPPSDIVQPQVREPRSAGDRQADGAQAKVAVV